MLNALVGVFAGVEPSLRHFRRARHVGCTRFFEGIGAAKGKAAGEGKSAIDDALATPEGMQLVTLFASMKGQKVRRRVVELVRSLADE